MQRELVLPAACFLRRSIENRNAIFSYLAFSNIELFLVLSCTVPVVSLLP